MSARVQWGAVIPCFNEEGTVARVVVETRHHLERVFVVDDGSSDRTAEVAQSAGAIVVRHKNRAGKGAALQSGCRAALNAGCAFGMILDGDGQHAPADIPKFLECAERTGAALVVGNRMPCAQSTMPLVRRLVNRWMSHRLSALARQTLPDTQCGFRLMNLCLWNALPMTTSRFEAESEMLLAFALAGHRIEFVPVQVIYGAERSKINPLKDAVRWFRWLRQAKRKIALSGT